MPSPQDITSQILAFRDARNWKRFNNPKDMALSLVLEATELVEHFQWKNAEEMDIHLKGRRAEIGEELADVLYWVLLMGHDFQIDVFDALEKKLEKNAAKYPVDKAKDVHTKYTEL